MPVWVEATVDAGEHLVRLVDEAQVERRRVAQTPVTRFAAGVFPPDQEYAIGVEIGVGSCGLHRLDAKQVRQLVLPLPEQGPWQDDEDAGGDFRHQLSDDEPRFDGLAETHLVGKDAAALRDSPEGEHHGIYLVRVRIHPASALRSNLPAPLARPPAAARGPRRSSVDGSGARAWPVV